MAKAAAAEVDNSPEKICLEVSKQTDSVIVSFSGGKDSLVLLSLCKKYFKNVQAFFLYIVKDLDYFETKLKYAEKKFDIRIKQYPHPELSRYLRNGICTFDAYETPPLSWNDIEDIARKDFQIDWIASGWKKTDSLQRRAALSTFRCEGIIDKSKKFFPLSNWNDSMVISYLRLHKLPIPKTNTKGQFEVSLIYKPLKFMKENYPKDYQKILEQFPFAETIIKKKRTLWRLVNIKDSNPLLLIGKK